MSTCQLATPQAMIHYGDFIYVGTSLGGVGVLMEMTGNCIKEIAADTLSTKLDFTCTNLKEILANCQIYAHASDITARGSHLQLSQEIGKFSGDMLIG